MYITQAIQYQRASACIRTRGEPLHQVVAQADEQRREAAEDHAVDMDRSQRPNVRYSEGPG